MKNNVSRFERIQQLLIFLLASDALAVFMTQLLRENAWLLIVLYWGLLSVKNIRDFMKSVGKLK